MIFRTQIRVCNFLNNQKTNIIVYKQRRTKKYMFTIKINEEREKINVLMSTKLGRLMVIAKAVLKVRMKKHLSYFFDCFLLEKYKDEAKVFP